MWLGTLALSRVLKNVRSRLPEGARLLGISTFHPVGGFKEGK
jgi:hypothetical protein